MITKIWSGEIFHETRTVLAVLFNSNYNKHMTLVFAFQSILKADDLLLKWTGK